MFSSILSYVLQVYSGGSRHSAKGVTSCGGFIRREGSQFSMFPSVSFLFLHWRGPKSIGKLDGGHGRICPPASAAACLRTFNRELCATISLNFSVSQYEEENKMSLENLAMVFGPTLLRP